MAKDAGALDQALVALLACPLDKGQLLPIGDEMLYNPRLRRAYPIEDGIPVLLVDEARELDEVEHEQVLRRYRSSAPSATASTPDSHGV